MAEARIEERDDDDDDDDDDDEIFVYMGGDQEVPRRVRRARIHKSVKIIPLYAFSSRVNLIYVEFHDGIEIIEGGAFLGCTSLRGCIKLLGIKIIKWSAFLNCSALTGVEFGDELETIEEFAFSNCILLKSIRMPSVRTIGVQAFDFCEELSDVECGEDLETIRRAAFNHCKILKRIALPLKDNMLSVSAFYDCSMLTAVDLVGGIHNTIESLHMESWRHYMKGEINSINQVLLNVDELGKTLAVQQWLSSVLDKIDNYKTEHSNLLKEATTLLELALWKANLDGNEGELVREGVRTTRGSRKRARKEMSVTSGASIVIKNVLPFLLLE